MCDGRLVDTGPRFPHTAPCLRHACGAQAESGRNLASTADIQITCGHRARQKAKLYRSAASKAPPDMKTRRARRLAHPRADIGADRWPGFFRPSRVSVSTHQTRVRRRWRIFAKRLAHADPAAKAIAHAPAPINGFGQGVQRLQHPCKAWPLLRPAPACRHSAAHLLCIQPQFGPPAQKLAPFAARQHGRAQHLGPRTRAARPSGLPSSRHSARYASSARRQPERRHPRARSRRSRSSDSSSLPPSMARCHISPAAPAHPHPALVIGPPAQQPGMHGLGTPHCPPPPAHRTAAQNLRTARRTPHAQRKRCLDIVKRAAPM